MCSAHIRMQHVLPALLLYHDSKLPQELPHHDRWKNVTPLSCGRQSIEWSIPTPCKQHADAGITPCKCVMKVDTQARYPTTPLMGRSRVTLQGYILPLPSTTPIASLTLYTQHPTHMSSKCRPTEYARHNTPSCLCQGCWTPESPEAQQQLRDQLKNTQVLRQADKVSTSAAASKRGQHRCCLRPRF